MSESRITNYSANINVAHAGMRTVSLLLRVNDKTQNVEENNTVDCRIVYLCDACLNPVTEYFPGVHWQRTPDREARSGSMFFHPVSLYCNRVKGGGASSASSKKDLG